MRKLKRSGRYPAGRKALLNFGRLRRLIERLAERHGTPCIEARLYSTVCPKCGREMLELQGRQVSCQRCGLAARRGDIPIVWAQRRFNEAAAEGQIPVPRPPPRDPRACPPAPGGRRGLRGAPSSHSPGLLR